MQFGNVLHSFLSRTCDGIVAFVNDRIFIAPAVTSMLFGLLLVAAHPYAQAQKVPLMPPSVAAYYVDTNGKLLVVEGNPSKRDLKVKSTAISWADLMVLNCEPTAHTDPNTDFDITGKASHAIYLMFDGDNPPKLLAVEDLMNERRKVKPPQKAGSGEVCCCTLIPCPPARKCCPCGTGC